MDDLCFVSLLTELCQFSFVCLAQPVCLLDIAVHGQDFVLVLLIRLDQLPIHLPIDGRSIHLPISHQHIVYTCCIAALLVFRTDTHLFFFIKVGGLKSVVWPIVFGPFSGREGAGGGGGGSSLAQHHQTDRQTSLLGHVARAGGVGWLARRSTIREMGPPHHLGV